jgi:hypothetical protein
MQARKIKLLGKHNRLDSGNLKAFAATHVLAGHHVVAAQHIGFRLGETSAVSFVSAAGKLILLGAHQPADFVFGGLLAMRTVQRRHLFFRAFIKKFALFHRLFGGRSQPSRLPIVCIIARHRGMSYGKMRAMAKKKKAKPFTAVEAVKTMAREQIGAPPASRIVPNRKKKTEKHKPTLEKLLNEPG